MTITNATHPLPPWGLHATDRIAPSTVRSATPANAAPVPAASRPTVLSRWGQRFVSWLIDPVDRSQDAWAVARRVERESPSFAAELRALAMNGDTAAEPRRSA